MYRKGCESSDFPPVKKERQKKTCFTCLALSCHFSVWVFGISNSLKYVCTYIQQKDVSFGGQIHAENMQSQKVPKLFFKISLKEKIMDITQKNAREH